MCFDIRSNCLHDCILIILMSFSLSGISTIFTAFFISTFVAGYTVIDIVDPFFVMFSSHAGGSVFVAAIAGVCCVIIVGMADSAFGIVVAIEDKVIVVCKRRRHPLGGAVAFRASFYRLSMQIIIR